MEADLIGIDKAAVDLFLISKHTEEKFPPTFQQEL